MNPEDARKRIARASEIIDLDGKLSPIELFARTFAEEGKPADEALALAREVLLVWRTDLGLDQMTWQLPPASGEFLVRLLLSKRKANALLGDFQETFNENCRLHRPRYAKWIWWSEFVHGLGPLIWAAMKRLGVIATLVDAARRVWSR
jgi:hypothetical protein